MNVLWLDWWSDYNPRAHWDQHLLISILDDYNVTHRTISDPAPEAENAVVVVPGGFACDDIERVDAFIAHLDRVFVVVTSDEASLFPYEQLTHPDMRLWVMTPRPGRGKADRYLGEGIPPGTSEAVTDPSDPKCVWAFLGQINHPGRAGMKAATAALTDDLARDVNIWEPTHGFAQGVDRATYMRSLCSAKVALCPAGPVTPDSFRTYEALEAGCLPLADARCPAYEDPGYWQLLCGSDPPFPLISDWEHDLHGRLTEALEGWPANANRAVAWWLREKQRLRWDIEDALQWLDGEDRRQDVTVLVSTSPIESHPSTDIIETTVASVRSRLPTADIVLMVDGVRPEREHHREAYDEYTRRLLWLANHRWERVYPIVADEWLHQANLTRRALEVVRTPVVLFMEHDTPLEQDIPFDQLVQPILHGDADLIRFHFESEILRVHRHLMLDRASQTVRGVRMMRTYQWSQRPHLASTAYYRDRLNSWFGDESRCFIEDVAVGVLDRSYRSNQRYGWFRDKLWIYTPEGNIRRSHHIDGRGSEEKGRQRFAYPDGRTPAGAPQPRWVKGS